MESLKSRVTPKICTLQPILERSPCKSTALKAIRRTFTGNYSTYIAKVFNYILGTREHKKLEMGGPIGESPNRKADQRVAS